MIDSIKISKMPYLAVSKNLMEFFIVIGYDETTLSQTELLLDNQKNIPLTILSTVISDLAFKQFEPYSIIKRVYPEKPKILAEKSKIQNSDVIFSSCIDSLKGNKKITTSGYALRFYEKYTDSNKVMYYVPKAFLIYSQYPYFNTYYQICKKLYEYINSDIKDKIPIEILIYCLINYIPSPFNTNIIIKDLGLNIKIPKLTGYPYADFDIINVINIVSVKDFIKIYILIYLEIPLLFFSDNLKVLNLFMFVLYLLNYPLTDSNYFWHIETISEKGLKSVQQAILQGFKGINTTYRENMNLSILNDVEFIIDLKGEETIVNRKETKESKQIVKLLKYIDKILNKKVSKSYFLQKDLLKLFGNLKAISEDYFDKNKDEVSKFDKYFNMNKEINGRNKIIQELFYDFIINNLIILNKDFIFDPTLEFPVKKKLFSNSNLSDEEKIFLKYARDSIKYNTYFDLFIKRFNVNDELKISLLFIDEFVNLKNSEPQDEKKLLPYFKIINNLYQENGKNESAEIQIISNHKKEIISNFEDEKKFSNESDKNKAQLFTLDTNLIKKFIFQKKNKDCYKTFEKPKELNIELIDKASIITVIQKHFTDNSILDSFFFVRISLIYVFSLVFPILSLSKSTYFLSAILEGLKKSKYFQRYYILILLKSINKYYNCNKEKKQFPNIIFKNVIEFYNIIQGYLKNNYIIQNEEIFMIFKSLLNEKEKKDDKKINEIKDISFFVYENPKKDEFLEIESNDYVKERLNLISFKRGGEIINYKKLRSDIIYQKACSLLEDYFTKYNFNIEKLEIDEIICLCINILFYLKDQDDRVIKCHLYNLIPLLKKLRNEINAFTTKLKKEKEKKEEEKEKDGIKEKKEDK